MNINWNIQVEGPYGVVIPTYGNYGGPGYSDGEVLASPDQPVDYSSRPVDELDALFLLHDQAYDSPDPLLRAEGDLALIEGISKLPEGTMDSEESLYGGFAMLFGMQQIVAVNDEPQLLSEHDALAYTREAVRLIERGLARSDAQELQDISGWLAQTAQIAATDVQQDALDFFVALADQIDLSGQQGWVGGHHLAGSHLVSEIAGLLGLTPATGDGDPWHDLRGLLDSVSHDLPSQPTFEWPEHGVRQVLDEHAPGVWAHPGEVAHAVAPPDGIAWVQADLADHRAAFDIWA